MCHFYENALSIIQYNPESSKSLSKLLQPEHLQAIRTLPSYRNYVEDLVDTGNLSRAQALLEEDDKLLFEKIESSLASRDCSAS